jgi:acylphosphatase
LTKVRVSVRIKGRVQGVFFRQSAKEEAQRLGLAGHVCNLPNGDVEAVAEGTEAAVDHFVAWCHHGPPSARVDQVQVREAALTGALTGFTVERQA